MVIKAIAVDKDGTFLKSDHTYDKAYFEKIFDELKRQDIKFIVASGNQYAQLQSFFPKKDQHITYVAENGAVTYYDNELMTSYYFDQQLIYDVVETLTRDFKLTDIVLSGIQSAYVKQTCSDEFLNFISNYYYDIEKVESFKQIENDNFVKVAMRIKDKDLVEKVINTLETKFAGELRAVTSGNDSVDLILPNVNKGIAIQDVLKQWGIKHDELLAFGDANNDIEMLDLTTHSYAMANCSPEVEAVAQHKAPSNDDSGVLQVIEQYLKRQK